MPVSDNIFTRIWQFVDQYAAGDYITRAAADIACDDLAVGVQAALDKAARLYAWDASGGTFPASSKARNIYVCTVAGTVASIDFVVGDLLIAQKDDASTTLYQVADWVAHYASSYLDASVVRVPTVYTGATITNPIVLPTSPLNVNLVEVQADGVGVHSSDLSLSGNQLTISGGWPDNIAEVEVITWAALRAVVVDPDLILLPDGRSVEDSTVIHFPTRAAFVTALGSYTFITGAVVEAGGFSYIKDGGTGISDMSGWSPLGDFYPEHFLDNTTPGTTDMYAAFAAAMTLYSGTKKYMKLVRGQTYALGTMVNVPGGTGIDSDGGIIKPLMYVTDASLNRRDNNAVIFDLSGELSGSYTPRTDQRMRGFSIIASLTDGQVVDGMHVRNCTSPVIEDIHFTGTGLFKLIKADTLGGFPVITGITASDITFSVALTNGTTANAQITVVILDGDRVNSTDSVATRIEADGRNLQQTGTALSTYGLQSDVVTVENGDGHHITAYGEDVGEVVDCQADYCVIRATGNGPKTGVKLIHGASFCDVVASIEKPLVAGVIVSGGTTGRGDTEHNHIVLNVDDCDPGNTATSTVAGIKFEDQTGSGQTPIAKNNTFEINCKLGTYTDYGVAFLNAAENNTGTGTISGTIVTELVVDSSSGSGNSFRRARETNIRAYIASNQAIADATDTKVSFDTESFDEQGEFDTTNKRFTCVVPGYYRVSTTVRWTGNYACEFSVRVNNSRVYYLNEAATYQVQTLIHDVNLDTDDYVEIFMKQSTGSSRNLSGGSDLSTLGITRL